MEFTESEKKEIEFLKTRYPQTRPLILPVLWMIQEREGWVSLESVKATAQILQVPEVWVEEVRSWYTLFHKKPKGKYVIDVCRTLSCALLGAEDITEHLCKKLKIKVGETTTDGMFTIQHAECLGSCGTGPMIQVGKNYYECLTPQKVDVIHDSLSQGKEIPQGPMNFPVYK